MDDKYSFGDEVFMSDKPMKDTEFGDPVRCLEFADGDQIPHLVLYRDKWQVVYWAGECWGWTDAYGQYIGDEHPRRNPGFDYCKPVHELVPNAKVSGGGAFPPSA